MASTTVHIGVALEGAGWHPAAWREPSSRPEELFTPGYWLDVVREAQRGLLDFVTIEDSLALQSSDRLLPDDRVDEVRGRLDALVLASRLAPVTEHIGLIPTVTTTFTEPFHVSKAIATLDYTSLGRAGVQPKLSLRAEEISHVGRGDFQVPDTVEQLRNEADAQIARAFAEASDAIEVVRRLWDSWEDDAEIRDAATDRFIDPAKLHTIDFQGEWFSVRGPSITPRPPQGQPVVAALAHARVPYEFAARQADIVFVTPGEGDEAAVLNAVREAERAVGRDGAPLRIYADLVLLLDDDRGAGRERGADRLARLDGLGRRLTSDARIVTGSAESVADLIGALVAAGYDGVRLRPGVLTDDLPLIADALVPELQRRGVFRTGYDAVNLREQLGLDSHPADRYVGSSVPISPAPASAL